MHIRLLLISFFLQFFPELIAGGHLFILETPALPRAQQEGDPLLLLGGGEAGGRRQARGGRGDHALQGPGRDLGGEFKGFIGDDIRLEPLSLHHVHNTDLLLSFFMGKNTPERQDFIIDNLRVEKDIVEA